MKAHHLALTVKNLGKSVNFYVELLGFNEIERFTKPGWDGEAAILVLGGFRLELFYWDTPVGDIEKGLNLKRLGFNHFGIQVENISVEHQRLLEAGVNIQAPQKGTTCTAFCFLEDPDGNSIELYQA